MSRADWPLRCVIDASIGFKWLVEEEDSGRADALLDVLNEIGAQFHVPDLFFIEIANILWKAVRNGRLTAALAIQAMTQLHQFELTTHNLKLLSADAIALSLATGTTAYDATYVALSAALDVPLITADAALYRQVRNRIDIRLLSEMNSNS